MRALSVRPSKLNHIILYALLFLIVLGETHGISDLELMQTEDRSFKTTALGVIGRTFGRIKKLQSALIPIVYKLGIISAVILMTFFLAFKSVFIGTIILILNLTFFALKIGMLLKSDNNHAHSINSWQPPKDIHLHIHNGQGKPDSVGGYNTVDANAQQYWNAPTSWENSPKRASYGRHLFYKDINRNVTNYKRVSNGHEIYQKPSMLFGEMTSSAHPIQNIMQNFRSTKIN